MLALRREGLLRPDSVHERCNHNDPFFLTLDNDALVDRPKGDALEVDAIPNGLMPLPQVALTADVGRTIGVCRPILDGWLRADGVLELGTGLAAILTMGLTVVARAPPSISSRIVRGPTTPYRVMRATGRNDFPVDHQRAVPAQVPSENRPHGTTSWGTSSR